MATWHRRYPHDLHRVDPGQPGLGDRGLLRMHGGPQGIALEFEIRTQVARPVPSLGDRADSEARHRRVGELERQIE